MPAHSSGATLLKSSEAGMRRTKSSSTTLAGVAALGDGAVPVDAAVGLRVASQAVLLLPGPAVIALAAGVDDRTDTDAVAAGVLGHVRSDLDHGAGDLVTDDLG